MLERWFGTLAGLGQAVAVQDLPLVHGDPFDRLLAAQAIIEPMHLVMHDRKMAACVETAMTW